MGDKQRHEDGHKMRDGHRPGPGAEHGEQVLKQGPRQGPEAEPEQGDKPDWVLERIPDGKLQHKVGHCPNDEADGELDGRHRQLQSLGPTHAPLAKDASAAMTVLARKRRSSSVDMGQSLVKKGRLVG
jgi:hypothetical protein